MTRRSLLVPLTAIALLLAGCAAQPGGSASTSAAPVPSASPSPSADLVAPRVVSAAGSLAHLPVRRDGAPAIAGPRWTVAPTDSGDRSVTITWADAASESCGAVDEAVVTETASSVVVALGRHAHAAGVLCPLVLALRHAVIPLAAPLGDRDLLEPANPITVPVPLPTSTCPPRATARTTGLVQVVPDRVCPLTGR